MVIQAKFFSDDKQEQKTFLAKLATWRERHGRKAIRTMRLKSLIIVTLPKYHHEEFRLIEPLFGLPLYLVCEECVDNDEANVVCDDFGRSLLPVWCNTNSTVNAKFSCDIKKSFISVRAKKKKDSITILMHKVSVRKKENSFYIEKKLLMATPKDRFFGMPGYNLYYDAAKAAVEKLEGRKMFPCFIREK